MSQRAWVELDRLNHQVKVHVASSPSTMIYAVNDYQPDLIIAPYLKTAIPESIWKNFICLIVHPGIVGDRGSCSLDWAILNNEKEWGVTIIQAAEKMDAGPVWATATFPMRNVSKSFLYRHEVTQAAMQALMQAVQKFEEKNFLPQSQKEIDVARKGKWNRSTNENDFSFSWSDDTDCIIRKINAADSSPGALCKILGEEYYCYGVVEEEKLSVIAIPPSLPPNLLMEEPLPKLEGGRGSPFRELEGSMSNDGIHLDPQDFVRKDSFGAGEILAQRHHAICIATKDGALWIQCLKKKEEDAIKLPAAIALSDASKKIPESSLNIFEEDSSAKTFREIWYEEANDVGYLHFDFYNGAMSIEQCNRLRQAYIEAKQRNTRVIVMRGGDDTWSNGIHLNLIEASENPAQASWENINAMNDLIQEIICTDTHYIISAMHGNAGAGGVALALAADKVIARKGIIFNPHTRNMGLYGSEYWTYLLPKRIGTQRALLFTEQCLPWGTDIALEVKLIDDCFNDIGDAFHQRVKTVAEEIARLSYYPQLLSAKKFKRNRDESYKPLSKYREEELEKMHKNFFEDDEGYDYKRYCFVHKINPDEIADAITDKDLFSERRKIWRRRKSEKLFYEA
ncbi:MAG: enoyl-CoA hydratase-related protein [Chitinophagales bacterium]